MTDPTPSAQMDRSVLDHLDTSAFQALLPEFLAANAQGITAAQVRGFVSEWTDEEYSRLLATLRTLGQEYRVYPADPACRGLARKFMGHVLTDVRLEGLDRLRSCMDAGRTVIITNHLSYIDAMATDAALANNGHADLADRIAYLAGPKVYQDLFRLVAAAAIHSLPVPQSPQLGHTEQLNGRELARRAIASLRAGREALEGGQSLLFYPEGSRTRGGRMGPFLKATRRYLKVAEFVVPAAIGGTDRIFGLDTTRICPGGLSLTVAEPIAVRGEGGRDELVAAHRAIAKLLPEESKPPPDTDALL